MLKRICLSTLALLIFCSFAFGDFVDNKDGTVTDTSTGLMWEKRDSADTYSWEGALEHANSITIAGYNDWRVPNINELLSIVDYDRYKPAINTEVFSSGNPLRIIGGYYWSSTTYMRDLHSALPPPAINVTRSNPG